MDASFFLMLFGLLICIFIIYLFLIMPAFDRRCAKRFKASLAHGGQRLYAHRGLYFGSEVPENSLLAFSRAASAGYGIEFDVRLSSDDIPVIFHDDSLLRMCGTDARPEDMTASELTAMPLSGSDQTIPLLSEALTLISSYGNIPLIVELKCRPFSRSLCEKTSALLDTYNGSYVIESFHPLVPHWFQQNRRQVVRGQLVCGFSKEEKKKDFSMRLLEKLLLNYLSRPDFIACPYKDYRSLSLNLCTRALGCMKFLWTVPSLSEAEELARSGAADAIIFEKGSL